MADQDVSKYFTELVMDHNQIISEMINEAMKNNETYGEAKSWITHQVDLVPTGKYIRRDDCDMFMGLVNRANTEINRRLDKQRIEQDDRGKEDNKEKEVD